MTNDNCQKSRWPRPSNGRRNAKLWLSVIFTTIVAVSLTVNATPLKEGHGLARSGVNESRSTMTATAHNNTQRSVTVDTLLDENDGDISPGNLSLREAIELAPDRGVIQFSDTLSGGVIQLTLGQLEIGKSISINGLGPSNLTVSGNLGSRVFRIDDDDDAIASRVTISGLTVADGRAFGGNFVGDGAGIFNAENLNLSDCIVSGNESSNVSGGIFNSGQLFVSNCHIRDNVGPFGAGIRNWYGNARIEQSTISENSATQFGGGIDNFGGRLELIDTTINGNSADRGGGLGVGGSGSGLVEISGSTISDNEANSGAGILNNDAITVINSLISNNAGEGVANQGSASIAYSTISGNSPGITNNGADIRIRNTTIITPNSQSLQNFNGTMEIVDSTTTGLGTGHPGLDVFGGLVRVTNSTISDHGVAGGGGGISGGGGMVVLQNSILALNEAATGPDCDRRIVSLGNNIFGDPSGCSIDLQDTDLTGDPGLGEFSDDGKPRGWAFSFACYQSSG